MNQIDLSLLPANPVNRSWSPPTGKRPLGSRCIVPIAHPGDGPTSTFTWPEDTTLAHAATFRVVMAVDDRLPRRIVATSGADGETPVGMIEALFGSPGQVYELPLDATQVQQVQAHGLKLALDQPGPPLWVVSPDDAGPASIRPHLLPAGIGDGAVATFLDRFCSMALLQPCDWMEACVLDGLADLSARGHAAAESALWAHLAVAFPASGEFIHENVRSEPLDNRPCGPENHGPIAALCACRPTHPAVALTANALLSQTDPDRGVVTDSDRLAAETSYSVAHTMMALAHHAGYDDFQDRALRQLRVNRDLLTEQDDVWLRIQLADGGRTYRNWSRGVAWYYLGLVRSLALMAPADRPADLLDEVKRMARWVEAWQKPDGSWPCFLKEGDTVPDSSGTAGIAAAVAIAVDWKMIGRDHLACAQRALAYLQARLTPDGWLTGVAPSNKPEARAMDIQRSRHRIIGPWGMGLMAQLAAALGDARLPDQSSMR